MDHDDLLTTLSSIYGEPVKFWGPYMCADGRMRVDIRLGDCSRTHQLARLVLEAKLGRRLTNQETVDHINGDFTDDSPENLQVLSRSENAAASAVRLREEKFSCPTCNTIFSLSGNRLRYAVSNRTRGSSGPFCGRSCAGKHNANVGHGKQLPTMTTPITRKYYTNKGV